MISIRSDIRYPWRYRILGIDNGTNTVGFTIIDHDLRTGISTVIFAETVTADRSAYNKYAGVAVNRSNLDARLLVINDFLLEVLAEYDPDIVGCESPFSHLNISTYRTLTLSMAYMDKTCYRHRRTLQFVEIPPGRAKKAVCPPGQYKTDKDIIRQFILDDDRIVAGMGVNLHDLDEHSVDGISVARVLALETEKAFT
jgi:Holliday junction resolvasome RuvABC endonuclease subunit